MRWPICWRTKLQVALERCASQLLALRILLLRLEILVAGRQAPRPAARRSAARDGGSSAALGLERRRQSLHRASAACWPGPRSGPAAAAHCVQLAQIWSVSTTAMTAAGSCCACSTAGSGRGERDERGAENDLGLHQNAVPTLNVKSLVSSPGSLEQGLGDIDAERAERRIPVDPDADREARARRIAEEAFLERRGADSASAIRYRSSQVPRVRRVAPPALSVHWLKASGSSGLMLIRFGRRTPNTAPTST